MEEVFKNVLKIVFEEIAVLVGAKGGLVNFAVIAKIDGIIEKALKEEGYYRTHKKNSAVFDRLYREELRIYNTQPTTFIESYNKQAFENFYKEFSTNFINTNLSQPIKDALMSNLATKGTLRDLQKTIKGIIDAKMISGRFKATVDEVYSVYQRSQGVIIADSQGVLFYRYKGGEIDTTREFCRLREGNIYSIAEIKRWADEDWPGKNTKTNSENVRIFLGGYNCRHRLMPVSESVAKDEGINKYNTL